MSTSEDTKPTSIATNFEICTSVLTSLECERQVSNLGPSCVHWVWSQHELLACWLFGTCPAHRRGGASLLDGHHHNPTLCFVAQFIMGTSAPLWEYARASTFYFISSSVALAPIFHLSFSNYKSDSVLQKYQHRETLKVRTKMAYIFTSIINLYCYVGGYKTGMLFCCPLCSHDALQAIFYFSLLFLLTVWYSILSVHSYSIEECHSREYMNRENKTAVAHSTSVVF